MRRSRRAEQKGSPSADREGLSLARVTALAVLTSVILLGPVDHAWPESPAAEFSATWMGYSQAAFQNLTLFDISLPGTHDTLTYDLSTTTSQSAVDSPIGAYILQLFTEEPLKKLGGGAVGEFMRLQAQTQTLSVTEQLDAGVRFLDFRASFEPGNDAVETGWYGYHFVITHQPMHHYLLEVNDWLEAHPTEMVIIWLSHHGSTCEKNQFPHADQEAYAYLANQLTGIFEAKLVNPATDGHPSRTTYAQYQDRRKQVVLYLSDHARFRVRASLDACTVAGKGGIDNQTGADVTQAAKGFEWELAQYSAWKTDHAKLKANGTLGLMSGATSTPKDAVKYQALLHFLGADRNIPPAYAWRAHCRNVFDLPKNTKALMTCPPTLKRVGQMTNYYHQRSMSFAVGQHGGNPADYRMPMAMYLDGMLPAGRFDTGPAPEGAPFGAGAYAYLGSMLRSALQHNRCDGEPGKAHPHFGCSEIERVMDLLFDQAPYNDPADVAHGRVPDWPPLPGQLPQCVRGFTPFGDNCVIEPYVALKDSMCIGEGSCQAPFDGMCSEGWYGHCHGNCALRSCHDDCIPDFRESMFQQIRDGKLHTQTDPANYYVCSVRGQWYSLPAAQAASGVDFAFNDGRGAGTKDSFQCPKPQACAIGYTQGRDGRCYLDPYVALKGDECPEHCSSASDACSLPWIGHSHGSCFSCHNDCLVNVSNAEESRIRTEGLHSIRDPAKYSICNTAGQWHTFTQGMEGKAGDLAFNTGRGSGGSKDEYQCKVP